MQIHQGLKKTSPLAQKAFDNLSVKENIKLKTVYDIDYSLVPDYISAADVVLLTSHFEGSPNIIKEAMACNCPIVSTDVGDVREVIGNTEGCYISSFDPNDVADKLTKALNFANKTTGRENTKHLDDKVIAQKLIDIYESVIMA